VRERVRFYRADGSTWDKELLSWVVGQAGLLWAAGPYPQDIEDWISDSLGCHGSYGHFYEHALADALVELYAPHMSTKDLGVRFFANGSDACAAVVRACRAATGKEWIISYGYHGSGAEFDHPPQNSGSLSIHYDRLIPIQWGNIKRVRVSIGASACIIVEVPPIEDILSHSFLLACRDLCSISGVPLVIDDVVLGHRIALGGSAEYYGVKPDIVILGKAMSAIGGISAIIGDRKILGLLEDQAFYSTTFGGNPQACAVALATLRWLTEHRAEVYGVCNHPHIFESSSVWERHQADEPIGHLRRIGRALMDGLNALGIPVVGQPERSVLQVPSERFPDETARRAWCSRMIEKGVMCDRPFFTTLAHTLDDVEKTLEAARGLS
jgi:glutamate-1-semialdehyde aminotransferase